MITNENEKRLSQRSVALGRCVGSDGSFGSSFMGRQTLARVVTNVKLDSNCAPVACRDAAAVK